jgi:hypothetical protein
MIVNQDQPKDITQTPWVIPIVDKQVKRISSTEHRNPPHHRESALRV